MAEAGIAVSPPLRSFVVAAVLLVQSLSLVRGGFAIGVGCGRGGMRMVLVKQGGGSTADAGAGVGHQTPSRVV